MAAVKVPVGGASGFVGRPRCATLAETGHDVAAATRHPGCYNGAISELLFSLLVKRAPGQARLDLGKRWQSRFLSGLAAECAIVQASGGLALCERRVAIRCTSPPRSVCGP